MSFISNLFKKKPGGTAVGNIIRGVVGGALSGSAAGAVIATGKNVMTQQDYDKTSLPDLEYYNKYGQTKNGVVLQEYAGAVLNQPIVPVDNTFNEIKSVVAKNWLKSNWYYVAAGVALLITAIYFITRKRKFRR